MREYLPLLIVGAIIGTFTVVFLTAYITEKARKKLDTRERQMKDGEILRRLLAYAKPYVKEPRH